jgi:hypothetical protein
MGDADEFGLLAERYEGLPVLKPNRARGPQARYADAKKFIEENAATRIDRAFWHELKATPLPTCAVSLYHSHSGDTCPRSRAKAGWGSSLDGNAVKNGHISGCGSSTPLRCGGGWPQGYHRPRAALVSSRGSRYS